MQLRSFPVVDRPVVFPSEITVVTRPAPPAWRTLVDQLHPALSLLPMVAVACGATAHAPAGHLVASWPRLLGAILLCGPLLTGAGNAIRAYFDRHLYESETPGFAPWISSDGLVAAFGLLNIVSLVLAQFLGEGMFHLACGTLAAYFALNAPPLRLRRHTWWNAVLTGAVSVMVPWTMGESLMAPSAPFSLGMPAILAFGAMGLQLAASLSRSHGERKAGLRTLAALLGPELGGAIAAVLVITSLAGAAIMAYSTQGTSTAGAIAGTSVLVLALQLAGLKLPVERRGTLVTAVTLLFMVAMAIAAFALGHPVAEL